MYSLIIAVLAGVGIALITTRDLGAAWGVVCGMFTVLLVQMLLGLWVRRKVNALNNDIQQRITAAQAKLTRKAQMLQQRPVGNPRMLQQMLEKEQNAALRDALNATDAIRPYYKWNLLLKKQINTMRMLFHFQLKEFDEADRLMPHCLFYDPRSIAVRLTRMYRKNDPGLDRFFARKAKRLKGEDCALVYSLYAYLQLKRGDQAGALKTLVEAKKRTDNPTVLQNWERLVNNKPKHFSNAGLGDAWYSLYLEEPKIKPQRMQQRPF